MISFFRFLWASKVFRYGLGALVSALSLYLALRGVDFGGVGEAIQAADYRLVGLALLSVAVNQLGRGFRWRVLLGASRTSGGRAGDSQARIPLVDLMAALFAGQLLNMVYPARAGDLSRAYVIGGRGPGRAFTLGTILLEKLLDTLAYGGLFVALLLALPLPAWVSNSASGLALATALVSVAAVILAYRPRWLLRLSGRLAARFPGRVAGYVQARLEEGVESLRTLRSPADLGRALFWTALIWGTAVLNNALVLQALQLHLPWTAPFFVLVVLQIGISLPSTPGSIGIFEYGCILALSLFSVERVQALSYGFVLHAVVFLPVIVLGFLAFLYLGVNVEKAESPLAPLDKGG